MIDAENVARSMLEHRQGRVLGEGAFVVNVVTSSNDALLVGVTVAFVRSEGLGPLEDRLSGISTVMSECGIVEETEMTEDGRFLIFWLRCEPENLA